MPGKYAPLTAYLSVQSDHQLTLSFAQIEAILRSDLPSSSRQYEAWWSNSPVPGRQNEAWLSIGWETVNLNRRAQTVGFRRVRGFAVPKPALPSPPPKPPAAAFDSQTLTATDLAPDCAVAFQLRWRRLGQIVRSPDGGLVFPVAPLAAGLYRFVVRLGNRTTIYVGESVNLSRRFGNYRRPGPTQQTNIRLNAVLLEALGGGGVITVDIVHDDVGLMINGALIKADLADKAVRRMLEHAAIVAHGGIDVEMLNQ